MGLIERVVNDDGPRKVQPGARAASRNGTAGPSFALDFEALGAHGLFTPEAGVRSHTLELRAIKRALLKRIGLLHRSGRGRRGVSKSGRQRNIVLVTSTRPGEGKTFTAVNLALSFALEDRQPVMLIDGDVLRPKVRSFFGFRKCDGLTDRLMNPALDVDALAWRAEGAPLSILTEGSRPGGATDLFSSDAARSFFAGLSTSDPDRLIIIDAPPMLATTEAFALARHADEVVFVVQADATPEPAAAVALDELLEVNPNVSLVLNRCLIPGGGSHYGSYETYDRTAPGAGDLGPV